MGTAPTRDRGTSPTERPTPCGSPNRRGTGTPYDGFLVAIAVLDDDPTGAQEVADTPVVLDWSQSVLAGVPDGPFHVVTNTRAHSSADAYRITRDAASSVLERFEGAEFVLRGDSTLRAHVREEYEAVRDVAFPGQTPVLLLVPALPAAGRVTIDGIQSLEHDGRRVPLHKTEYATDGAFAYRSARLLDWADERSDGLFNAARGSELGLAELRSRGEVAVREMLETSVARAGPVACAPDAETDADLETIAAGFRAARDDGAPVIVRSAPAFAAIFCGTRAKGTVPVPRRSSLVVVCGSHVPQTTRQLEALLSRRPGVLVELEIPRLLTGEREEEVARAVEAARASLLRSGLAVVATPRERSELVHDASTGAVLAESLARLTSLLSGEVDLVLFKGGITSAVGVRDGLGWGAATVVGPVEKGVSLWQYDEHRQCLVFPGNVGDDNALARVVSGVLN